MLGEALCVGSVLSLASAFDLQMQLLGTGWAVRRYSGVALISAQASLLFLCNIPACSCREGSRQGLC